MKVTAKDQPPPTLMVELDPATARAFLRYWGNAGTGQRMAAHSEWNGKNQIDINEGRYTEGDDSLLAALYDEISEHVDSCDALPHEN